MRSISIAFLSLSLGAFGQKVNMDVKTGLWELVTTTQSSGSLVDTSKLDTSKLTPEARARIEAMAKARQSKVAEPHTRRDCITKEKLEKDQLFDSTGPANCTRTIVTNTRTVMEVKVDCQNEKMKSTSTARFEAVGRDAMKGTMTINTGAATINTAINGKWISDSCGDVK